MVVVANHYRKFLFENLVSKTGKLSFSKKKEMMRIKEKSLGHKLLEKYYTIAIGQ